MHNNDGSGGGEKSYGGTSYVATTPTATHQQQQHHHQQRNGQHHHHLQMLRNISGNANILDGAGAFLTQTAYHLDGGHDYSTDDNSEVEDDEDDDCSDVDIVGDSKLYHMT